MITNSLILIQWVKLIQSESNWSKVSQTDPKWVKLIQSVHFWNLWSWSHVLPYKTSDPDPRCLGWTLSRGFRIKTHLFNLSKFNKDIYTSFLCGSCHCHLWLWHIAPSEFHLSHSYRFIAVTSLQWRTSVHKPANCQINLRINCLLCPCMMFINWSPL